jgi:FMN phosphatase YigB (HAD superfamily)
MAHDKQKISLIVTDIDNTVFDWVSYYVESFKGLLDVVSRVIDAPADQLATESKAVFEQHGSIEYPFLIQELPSVNQFYKDDIDAMLNDCVRLGRDRFLEVADSLLRPYESVIDTFKKIKRDYPRIPVVALTDAPRYVAMWKLNKLGLLQYFDSVYGLADPRIPTCETNRRVKVDPEILLKHLKNHRFDFEGRIRILPDEYEKPGVRGLKTVLMDHDMDEPYTLRREVLWIGDNLRKDVGLGSKLGVVTAWAEYGTRVDSHLLQQLHTFSPAGNVQKNVFLPAGSPDAPTPDFSLVSFADLMKILD